MNLTISIVTYRVGASKLSHFRHTLLVGMLQGQMPFEDISFRTPFRVFHVDTLLTGSSKDHHGFIVITRMHSTNTEPDAKDDHMAAHRRYERQEQEVIDLLVTTYDLEACTSKS